MSARLAGMRGAVAAGLLLAALVPAACGGDGSSSPAPPANPAPPGSGSPPTTPTEPTTPSTLNIVLGRPTGTSIAASVLADPGTEVYFEYGTVPATYTGQTLTDTAAAGAPMVVEFTGLLPFPDEASWGRYVEAGGRLARDDWRRANVNALVQGLHQTTRANRPQARLGISPFGIGRPARRPPGIEGFSQYDRLYADVELWLAQSWCDYLAPQLYWPIDRAPQAFATLLAYWVAQNPQRRHIWPGLYASRVGAAREPWPAAEVVNQVGLARMKPGSSGHLHFSMVALMQDRDGIATRYTGGPLHAGWTAFSP